MAEMFFPKKKLKFDKPKKTGKAYRLLIWVYPSTVWAMLLVILRG